MGMIYTNADYSRAGTMLSMPERYSGLPYRPQWRTPYRKHRRKNCGLSLEAIAFRLRSTRVNHGWSLTGLSHVTGINKDSLAAYERGKYMPTSMQVERIGMALGVSYEQLIFGRGYHAPAPVDS